MGRSIGAVIDEDPEAALDLVDRTVNPTLPAHRPMTPVCSSQSKPSSGTSSTPLPEGSSRYPKRDTVSAAADAFETALAGARKGKQYASMTLSTNVAVMGPGKRADGAAEPQSGPFLPWPSSLEHPELVLPHPTLPEYSDLAARAFSKHIRIPTAFHGEVSPQLARALQATENIWRHIEAEYGMLTSTAVARLIGTEKSGRSFTSRQRAAGKLIGIQFGNGSVLYPGFQFDRTDGKVNAVIPELLRMAKDVGWDEKDLVLWLVAPSGYFDGDRPVDHLNDENLVAKGRQKANVEW